MIPRFAAALLVLLAQAQSPAPPAPAAAPVHVNATILGADGRPAKNLQARDIELREDGVVQQIASVEARAAEPRRIAVLMDEFHVDASATTAVRDAVHWFVEEHLRAGDEVAIVKPLDSLPAIHFTPTRDRLHDSIESFEGRKENYTPRTTLEAETVGQAPALAEAARAQIVLSALRSLATRLGGMPGRPAIVLISEGFVRDTRPVTNLPDADMVERFANRFDVPVYTMSPGAARNDAAEELLRTLASRTGGEFRSESDLRDALSRVADELDGGYLITYRPSHPADGKFHEVQVTARRKDARVRTRAGYVSVIPFDRLAHSRAPLLSSRMLRRSPFLSVWAGVTALSAGDGHVVVTWGPSDSGGLDSRNRAAKVALKATKPDGTVLFDGTLVPVRSGAPGNDHAEFDAPTGPVQLDMTVLGRGGEKLDTDTRDVTVPPIGRGTLLLPPLVTPTRSAREFRDVSGDARTAPEPEREFSRTERLLIRVPAYSTAAEPQVTARLLNRVGQQIRVLDVAPGTPAGVTQFDLSLAPLAPGEYILEFKATAPTGIAEQRVTMRIIG